MQTSMAIVARVLVYRNIIPVPDSYAKRRACHYADSSMMTNALPVLNDNCASIQRNEQKHCNQYAQHRKNGGMIPHSIPMRFFTASTARALAFPALGCDLHV